MGYRLAKAEIAIIDGQSCGRFPLKGEPVAEIAEGRRLCLCPNDLSACRAT